MGLLNTEQVDVLGKHPISADKPAGESIRLEPLFESIEAEVAKLDDFTAKEPVRWNQVLEGARQILEKESKDFLVACYLTRSLCEEDLLTGFNQGIEVARGLAEQFWDQAHPPKKRVRGRSQAFEWLVEKCHPLLESYQPRGTDSDLLDQVESNVIALDDYLIEKMADNAPNFAEFRQTFRRLKQGLQVEQQAATKQQAASTVQSARPSATQANTGGGAAASSGTAAASVSAVTSDKDLMAAYRAIQEQLRLVTQHLGSKNPSDPELFRINRFITWLGVNQVPPSTNGKTQLRPLAKDKLETYQGLYQDKQWAALIPEIEQSLVRAPFWLDGQRMVAEALDAMDNQAAKSAVQDGVKAFVSRLPDVVNGLFSDDSPFASDATKQWIQREVMASGAGSGSGETLAIDTANIGKDWEAAFDQALALAQEKQMRQALGLFQQGVARSTSKREQTLWQFNQARFCFDHGLVSLATPLLEHIDKTLTQSGASDWEPQLTKQILQLLLRCYESQDTPTTEEKTKVLHARLCQLDLAMAFDLVNH